MEVRNGVEKLTCEGKQSNVSKESRRTDTNVLGQILSLRLFDMSVVALMRFSYSYRMLSN